MKTNNFTKMKGFIFLALTLSFVTIIGAVYFVDAGIRYSYGDSFGTGIAVSENGFWIPDTIPNLTIGQTQTVKYYIDNKVANTTANVRITLKLDSQVIADYYENITNSHTKTVNLNLYLSNLECNSSHTLYLKIEDSNDEDCSLGDNCAQRKIIVSCGTPAPICGDGNLSENEQCDYGNNNGISCSAEYNSNCHYCSDFCELKTIQGEFCGDGILNSAYERCDDGNLVNGDGCTMTCKIEGPGRVDGGLDVEKFKPIVWQCGDRIMTDENVQPWRFSGENEFLYERAGNYLFDGEKFQVNVVVFDKNKIQDVVVDLILDSDPNSVGTVEDAKYSVNCVEVPQLYAVNRVSQNPFERCNAQIGEEEINEFDPSTMKYYECSITILDSENMYGKYWLTVLADDGVNSGVYDEMTPLWINPIITLSIDGSLNFENIRPGTSSYSQVSITNEAQGGVALDMFITGKDWPSTTPGNLGRCALNTEILKSVSDGEGTEELVDYIPLNAFRYYAENGAFTTRYDEERDGGDGLSAPFDTVNYDTAVDRDSDDEGYVTINKQINAGFEEAMFDDAEIIQVGGPVVETPNGKEYGYRANVLNSGSLMALTFRLNLPESCYGEFESPESGSIFIWGEAI